jgi:hypothetical protein
VEGHLDDCGGVAILDHVEQSVTKLVKPSLGPNVGLPLVVRARHRVPGVRVLLTQKHPVSVRLSGRSEDVSGRYRRAWGRLDLVALVDDERIRKAVADDNRCGHPRSNVCASDGHSHGARAGQSGEVRQEVVADEATDVDVTGIDVEVGPYDLPTIRTPTESRPAVTCGHLSIPSNGSSHGGWLYS